MGKIFKTKILFMGAKTNKWSTLITRITLDKMTMTLQKKKLERWVTNTIKMTILQMKIHKVSRLRKILTTLTMETCQQIWGVDLNRKSKGGMDPFLNKIWPKWWVRSLEAPMFTA